MHCCCQNISCLSSPFLRGGRPGGDFVNILNYFNWFGFDWHCRQIRQLIIVYWIPKKHDIGPPTTQTNPVRFSTSIRNGDRITTVTDVPIPWCGPVVALNYGAWRGGIHDIVYRRTGRWEASRICEAILGLEEESGAGKIIRNAEYRRFLKKTTGSWRSSPYTLLEEKWKTAWGIEREKHQSPWIVVEKTDCKNLDENL